MTEKLESMAITDLGFLQAMEKADRKFRDFTDKLEIGILGYRLSCHEKDGSPEMRFGVSQLGEKREY